MERPFDTLIVCFNRSVEHAIILVERSAKDSGTVHEYCRETLGLVVESTKTAELASRIRSRYVASAATGYIGNRQSIELGGKASWMIRRHITVPAALWSDGKTCDIGVYVGAVVTSYTGMTERRESSTVTVANGNTNIPSITRMGTRIAFLPF